MEPSPAFIKTATWDVVAWNRAALVVLADYGGLPPEQRNILRELFLNPRAPRSMTGRAPRFVVGATAEVGALVEELCRFSPESPPSGGTTTPGGTARASSI